MIQINKPYICKKCSQKLISYSINPNTNKLVFYCDNCKKTYELSETEYLKELSDTNKTK